MDRITIRKVNELSSKREFEAALVGAKIKLPRISVESEKKFDVDKNDIESKISDEKAMHILKQSLAAKLAGK